MNPLSLSTLTLTATSLLGGPQEGEEKAWVERRQHDHIMNETCKLRGVGTKTMTTFAVVNLYKLRVQVSGCTMGPQIFL